MVYDPQLLKHTKTKHEKFLRFLIASRALAMLGISNIELQANLEVRFRDALFA